MESYHGLGMPMMEWGCKNVLGKHFQNLLKIGFTLERGFSRSSRHADNEAPLEHGLPRSGGLQTFEKVLVACFSRSMDARPTLERETQTLARARIPSLERTAKHMIFWTYAYHVRLWPSTLERKCMYSECMLELEVLYSSVDRKFGISRLILKHQTQPLKLQTRFFWAKTWEKIHRDHKATWIKNISRTMAQRHANRTQFQLNLRE